ncbi:sigma E positive regulator RseC/MucC [Marinobacter fuscus]|uniref:Sigma E positive regulator RseC/MucC n=1 Tax=Marinobacter fuscus TaxID=2109942 RepID=A0A2T1KKK9_9GAMM|nr:SoxR reducing system RseC family protein [Marinobacter fuscus]PSF10661.1 sigma E positive regulator RseC/MucC [Marinobacter fuscus]
MITETGRVVAEAGSSVWVQTIRTSACQSCAARSGCGQRVLAAASGGKANQVLIENTIGARVGDDVIIGLDEQALLRASVAVYGGPLVLMVAGSILMHRVFGPQDIAAIGGALAGLGAGFLLVRRWQARAGERYKPRLLRVNTVHVSTCL